MKRVFSFRTSSLSLSLLNSRCFQPPYDTHQTTNQALLGPSMPNGTPCDSRRSRIKRQAGRNCSVCLLAKPLKLQI